MLFLPLKYLYFCPDFFGHVGKRLEKKAKVISKFMTSETAQQIITVHILFNTSGSKVNQAMKFGLLIEYNMRNIFIEKSSIKCCQEASPGTFYKNQH